MEVFDSSENFDTWINQKFVRLHNKERLNKADILIVPTVNFRVGSGPTFETGTLNFFRYFKESLPSQYSIELCIDEDEYAELSLNSNYKRIGKFIVNTFVLPIFINVLSSFIEDLVKDEEKQQIYYNVNNFSQVTNVTNVEGETKSITVPNEIHKKYMEPAKIKVHYVLVNKDGSSTEFRYEGSANEIMHTVKALNSLHINDTDTTKPTYPDASGEIKSDSTGNKLSIE